MSFISYSQNAEDVILWRALKHIEQGFYIDVGANDPEDDSVTKAFYDRGWHGINIEPLPQHHACLQMHRTRDINLLLAAGEQDGQLSLYDVSGVRGWATSDAEVAEQYRQQGYDVVASTVPVKRLDHLCQEQNVGEVHFLKIDVEGFEAQVIRGMDFERWRPWILVVEAVQPNSEQQQYESWEPILLENRYRYVYTDGLNRYYVAEEHQDLAAKLAIQPNVLDDYRFIGYERAEQALQRVDQQNQQLQQAQQQLRHALQQSAQELVQTQKQADEQIKTMQATLRKAHQEIQALNVERYAMINSLSWRITEPLRQLNVRLKQLRLAVLQPDAAASKNIGIQVAQFMLRHLRVRSLIRKIRGQRQPIPHAAAPSKKRPVPDNLPPAVLRIYQDIQRLDRSDA